MQTPTTPSISSTFLNDTNLWSVVDPDIAHENPVEDKHRRLVRSHRSSPYDRELKPNAKIRDELGVSLLYLSRHLDNLTTESGHSQLFSEPTPDIGRERPDLEVQVLPCPRQEGSDQVPQIGGMARFVGSEASCGRTAPRVDGN